MLQPSERATLLESLTPPSGYGLEIAVGTTFSLNLLTLITTPWAFAVYEAMQASEDDAHEAVGLLDAVRRNADKITVFCQSGQIAVDAPTKLLPLMERSVVPVSAPYGGLFHPKVWVLGFKDVDGHRTHRMLVSSRNLTTDRSWDTLLRIDQTPQGEPLAQLRVLLLWLAGRCTSKTHALRAEEIGALAKRLERVRWAIPQPFESMTFYAMGLPRGTRPAPPPRNTTRLLVVSPFVTVDRITELQQHPDRTLISTAEALDALPADLDVGKSLVLDRDASPNDGATADSRPADPSNALVGLHAKLLAFDHGWNTTYITGSANMTTAGWSQNVEIVVELTGKKSKVGLTTLLDPQDESPDLQDLLEPYPLGKGTHGDDPLEGGELDHLRRELAGLTYTGHITPKSEDAYEMRLTTVEDVRHIAARMDGLDVWPLLFDTGRTAATMDDRGRLDVTLQIPQLSDVTSFVGLSLRLGQHDTAVTVLAVLVGLPEGRDRAVLNRLLAHKDRLLRYLLLLLADASGSDALNDHAAWLEQNAGSADFGRLETPLLEAVLRAAHRGPEKLAPFQSLLADLGESAAELLPDGFLDLWAAVQDVVATAGEGDQ